MVWFSGAGTPGAFALPGESDGVGTHGESACALNRNAGVVDHCQHDLAHQLGGLVVQGDAAQVDVVVRFLAAGEDNLAADHRQLFDEFKKAGTGSSSVDCRETGGSHGS